MAIPCPYQGSANVRNGIYSTQLEKRYNTQFVAAPFRVSVTQIIVRLARGLDSAIALVGFVYIATDLIWGFPQR
jgi:hypothetical protein